MVFAVANKFGYGFLLMEKIITAIEPQKKNRNRFSIFLDGEFAFGVSKSLALRLKAGDYIDEKSIEELLDSDKFERAWQKALQFLNYRSRTVQELKEKMEELGFEDCIVSRVVNDCREKGYINDQNFADQWVETRSHNKPRSHRLLALELKRKKVTEVEISKALLKAVSDQDLAMAASKKYWRRLTAYEVEEKKTKLQGHLLRRGFSYDVIRETVNKMVEINETGN